MKLWNSVITGIAFLTLVAGGPARAETFYEDALVRLLDGDYRGAIIQLKNALQKDPNNLSARILIGKAYVKVKEYKPAIEALRHARTAGGDDALIAEPLAEALFGDGKYEDLVSSIRSGGFGPEINSAILVWRGRAYLQLRRLEESANALSKAHTLQPDQVGPLLG